MITIGDVDAAVQANWNTQPNLGDIIAPYIIYGGVNIGDAGTPLTTGIQNGISGNRIENNKVLMHHIAYDWSGVTNNAVEGANGENSGDGGGLGGFGDRSIYGGLSVGGAGASEGTGGFGGEVTNNSVSLKDVTLTGANGGGGGSSMGGGGGMGGIGGASILGGLSIGGTGGFKRAGGSGGFVSYNTVTLTNVALIGANGGSGNYGSNSVGGFGGFGGGSVYGGLSMGGIGGAYMGTGGSGGTVSDNKVSLTNVTIIGGEGGSSDISGSEGMEGGREYLWWLKHRWRCY